MDRNNNLITIAENELKIYEAGKKAQHAEWWDKFIAYRSDTKGRLLLANGFSYWSPDHFYPTRDMEVFTATQMFYYFNQYGDTPFDLKARLEECGVKLDLSTISGVQTLAFGRSRISRLPEIDLGGNMTGLAMTDTFRYSTVEYIEKLKLRNGKTCSNAFGSCSSLTHVIFEVPDDGKIQGTWDFSYSPLDVESMKSIIDVLYDYSGTDEEGVYSILFPETSWEALEADSVAPDDGTWRAYAEKLGYLT